MAAGVELRDRCQVTGLLRDDAGRVTGVEGRWQGGSFTEQARLVIGADGMRSTVARLAEAPYTVADDRLTCAYYTYWQDVPADLELYEAPGSWTAAVPTNDGLTLVLAYFPQARFEEVRTDARRAYLEQVRTAAPPCTNGSRTRNPPSGCAAPATSRTTSGRRPVPAGSWSATRATTRTRSPPAGSVTPSARSRPWWPG